MKPTVVLFTVFLACLVKAIPTVPKAEVRSELDTDLPFTGGCWDRKREVSTDQSLTGCNWDRRANVE